jgi:hypothetical protein
MRGGERFAASKPNLHVVTDGLPGPFPRRRRECCSINSAEMRASMA